MSHLDDNAVPVQDASPGPAEVRSRRLHAEFEAYYAARERRRLSEEAFARRHGSRPFDGTPAWHLTRPPGD